MESCDIGCEKVSSTPHRKACTGGSAGSVGGVEHTTSKSFAILTDNGSNMLKAFHSSFVESEDDQDDKGSGDQEEKDAYEKERGNTEEDKDMEESAMQEISVDQEEEEECDRMERNHEVAFDGIITCIIKRLSRFAHTLQLVVNMFNDVWSLSRVLASAHALVKKVNKSSKASEKLIALSGRKLISDCPMQWSSTFC